jgi:uncharacterized protein YigA (DUF484 family)
MNVAEILASFSSMNSISTPENLNVEMTKKIVIDYLRSHPGFLMENPEILETLIPPAQNHGGGVVDFQFFALDNLRRGMGRMKERFQSLVTSARDNMSVQQQVHKAALSILKAETLEQLLDVLASDLVTWFDVDVVRLAMESEMAGLKDTYYSEGNYSGICFVPSGTTNAALLGEKVRLIADTQAEPPIGFEMIFADCSSLVRSCALLRLEMPATARPALLAFGVRDSSHFTPGQGSELLGFLAAVMSNVLTRCLRREDWPMQE